MPPTPFKTIIIIIMKKKYFGAAFRASAPRGGFGTRNRRRRICETSRVAVRDDFGCLTSVRADSTLTRRAAVARRFFLDYTRLVRPRETDGRRSTVVSRPRPRGSWVSGAWARTDHGANSILRSITRLRVGGGG